MRIELNHSILGKLATGLTLASLVACGGGGGSSSSAPGGGSTSTKLIYTDPTPSGTQWALMRDAASTDKHLILNLVPPSDAVAGFGVAFTISAPTSAGTWTKVASADPQLVENKLYALGGGVNLIKATSAGGTMKAGVFQKGLATAPVAHTNGAVASIAFNVASNASATASVAITLTGAQELQASGMQPITIVAGTLAIQK